MSQDKIEVDRLESTAWRSPGHLFSNNYGKTGNAYKTLNESCYFLAYINPQKKFLFIVCVQNDQ